MNDNIGKLAEARIRTWLNKPNDGISFDRIPDQMTGFYGSKNICDFICFKSPYLCYIESKATWNSRFDFSYITDTQMCGLLEKSGIENVFGLVIVLFATYKRAFAIDIKSIQALMLNNKKSINIKTEMSWSKSGLIYKEINTVPSRKTVLDYDDNILEIIEVIKNGR